MNKKRNLCKNEISVYYFNIYKCPLYVFLVESLIKASQKVTNLITLKRQTPH